MTTALYVIPPGHRGLPHVALAAARLRQVADRLVVVAPADQAAALAAAAPDLLLPFEPGPETVLAGYRTALGWLFAEPGALDEPAILASAETFGPTGGFADHLAGLGASEADLVAPYWHAPALDPGLKAHGLPARVPHLDFAILAPGLLRDAGFQTFWRDFRPPSDGLAEFLAGPAALAAWMERAGRRVAYALPETALETVDPRLQEVHKLVAQGAFCIPTEALTLSPVEHDLGATYLRAALDRLRGADPELYAAVIAFASRRLKLRDFNTIADQYEVLPLQAADPGKRTWSFGRVAVFIHAFYSDMMPEFWQLTQRLPCPVHLFLTTASDRERAAIEAFLSGKGLDGQDFTVRVVEQNRGRDMSSLFITWRDVVLEGGYEVALRLHSKRTPQVSRQVGESFKEHLFENLAAAPGYVANLLDRLEAEPDIGLVIPPVIHIGFATLGHSWFSNHSKVRNLLDAMGLDEVPLDDSTPVAPYGTMFWFRPEALRPLFERRWRWDEYNAEPHHVDGGLAHVQERLIGYVAQGRGYRVYTVMTPRLAARYYAKLEYKAQRLSAALISGNIRHQVRQLESRWGSPRARLVRGLTAVYAHILARWPGMRGPLRPFKNLAIAVLGRSPP